MKTVADIMIRDVISLNAGEDLYQARMSLQEHGIRHIPVLDDERRYAGLLTQKALLNHAFRMVEKYGFAKLNAREQRTAVEEVMCTDCPTINSTTPLQEAGEYFLQNKQGCLPVVDDGRLVGIVTPVDFVRLALASVSD